MEWIDAKSLVVEAIGYDGTSSKSLSQIALGTPTDTRLQLVLRNFSVETFSFFTRSAAVTFQDGDWELIDLTDFSRCALSMCKVLCVNFNSQYLCASEGVGQLARMALNVDSSTGIPTKAAPREWAESDEGKIDLDCPVDMSGNAPAWIIGYYRHPVILYDTSAAALAAGKPAVQGQCQLDEKLVFAWSAYASVSLAKGVVSASVAMERLKSYNVEAYTEIMRKRSENLNRYTRGLFGNSRGLLPGSAFFPWTWWPR